VQTVGPSNQALSNFNATLNAILEMDDEVRFQQILKGLDRARERGSAVLLDNIKYSNNFGLRLWDSMPFNNGSGRLVDGLPFDGINVAVGDKDATFLFTFATFANGYSTFSIHYHAHIPHGKAIVTSLICRPVTFKHELPAIQLTHDDAALRTWERKFFTTIRKLVKNIGLYNTAPGVSETASAVDSLIDVGYQIRIKADLKKLPRAGDNMYFRVFDNPATPLSQVARNAADVISVDKPRSDRPNYDMTISDLLNLVNSQRIPVTAKENAELILAISPQGEQLARLYDFLAEGCNVEDLRVLMYMFNEDYNQNAVPVVYNVDGKPSVFYVNYMVNRTLRYMIEQPRSAKSADGQSFVSYIPVYFASGSDAGKWAAQIKIWFNQYGQVVEVAAHDTNGNSVRKIIEPVTGKKKIVTMRILKSPSEERDLVNLTEETNVLEGDVMTMVLQKEITTEVISPNQKRVISEEYEKHGNKRILVRASVITEKLKKFEENSIWVRANTYFVKPLENNLTVEKTGGEKPAYSGQISIINSKGEVVKGIDGKVFYKDGKYVISGITKVVNSYLTKERKFGIFVIPEGTPMSYYYSQDGTKVSHAVCHITGSSEVILRYYEDAIGVVRSDQPFIEELYDADGNLIENSPKEKEEEPVPKTDEESEEVKDDIPVVHPKEPETKEIVKEETKEEEITEEKTDETTLPQSDIQIKQPKEESLNRTTDEEIIEEKQAALKWILLLMAPFLAAILFVKDLIRHRRKPVKDIEVQWEKKVEEFLKLGKGHFRYEEELLLNNWNFVENALKGKMQLPLMVDVQPTSICNNRCRWCIGDKHRPTEHVSISESTMLKLIDNLCGYGVKTIRFSGYYGEPLCNPATIPAAKKAIDKGMRVGLHTNGRLLNRQAREVFCQRMVRAYQLRRAKQHSTQYPERDIRLSLRHHNRKYQAIVH
ncbi:MAG: radical SAM protein, partial [Candidatus Omnitrophica bacterium]|nr:radical SAM protein [Candidatus Omnitrophota bacterium]